MRFSLLLITVATGLAAAQTVTVSTAGSGGPSQDLPQCIVVCAEQTAKDNPGAAKDCDGLNGDAAATCICKYPALVSEMQSCLTSTCPAVLPSGFDFKQGCTNIANGKPGNGAAGAMPVSGLAAFGALIAGAFLA